MVRAFELIFDNHGAICSDFAGHDIARQFADSAFPLIQLEIQTECRA